MRLISPASCLVHVLAFLGLGVLVAGLGSQCSAPVTSGTASPSAPFWLEQIQHQGSAPFNSHPGGYKVFRNVKACSPLSSPLSIVLIEAHYPGLRREGRWYDGRYCSNKVRLPVLRHVYVANFLTSPSSSAAISSGNRCGSGCGQSS